MHTDLLPVAEVIRQLKQRRASNQVPAADVVELDSRLRPFSCPTGLHDFCSKTASHAPAVESGIAG